MKWSRDPLVSLKRRLTSRIGRPPTHATLWMMMHQ
jgi:hypothetical protein